MTAKSTATGLIPEQASRVALAWGEREPDRTAIRSEVGAISYGRLALAIRSTVAMLSAHGFEPGDRLLIVSENSIATVVLFFASLELGVIASIVNARLTAAELAKIQSSARAKRTIYLSAASADAAHHATKVAALTISDPLWGEALIGTVSQNCAGDATDHAMDRSIACIAYTTGTTGTPKGVALSHSALAHMGRLSVPAVSSSQQAHYYLVSPLAHIIGFGSNLMAAMWSGASVELVARFDVNHMIEALTSGRITHLMCVPTVYAAILSLAKERRIERLPNGLLSTRAGGAPLSVALKEEIDVLLGLPLENGYGMTECCAIARTHSGESPVGSVGRPNDGVHVRILHSPETVDQGEPVGKLLVKSPCAATGLWQDGRVLELPEMRDGWLDTGDLGRLDSTGNLFLVGRSKEIIIRSGFNVAPAEIEQVICRHDGVSGCAVVGHPKRYEDIEIVAFVTPTSKVPRVSASELAQHCKTQLAGYKCPSRFLFIDTIPLLPNGKIDRQSLLIAAGRQTGRHDG